MIKIYLKSKILTDSSPEFMKMAEEKYDRMQGRRRNRRLKERFKAEQKHITLLNDQDILVVKNISEQGMSTYVSDRAFERFTIGDVYSSKIRFDRDIHDLNIKVMWKEDAVVGFEIESASRQLRDLLHRLIVPLEIAASLKEYRDINLRESSKSELDASADVVKRYHGLHASVFNIWTEKNDELKAWQINVGELCTLWNKYEGLRTGRLVPNENAFAFMEDSDINSIETDRNLNTHIGRMAKDILLSIEHDLKEDLIETVMGYDF